MNITCRRLNIALPTTGILSFPTMGDFVFVEAASTDLLLRAVSVADGANCGDDLLLRRAVSHKFRRTYDQLTVTGAAGATATLWVGEGESNLNLISGSVTIAAGGTFDSSANAAIAGPGSLDFAADSTRLELHLQPDPANTANLTVRDQSGTTDEGILIGPTGLAFYVLPCAGASRVRNTTAGSLNLRYAEVKT